MTFIAALPAPLRHLLLFVLADGIVIGAPYIPSLHLPTVAAALLAPVVTLALAWATPLVQSYGVGASTADQTA